MAEKQVDVMELEHKPEEFKDPTEDQQKRLAYVQKRFHAMEKGRAIEEPERIKAEKVMKAKVPKSKTGKAEVNIPLEKALLETYIGMQEKLQFQVKNVRGKLDYDYQYIYEMVFDHFYTKEMVAREIRRYRRRKGKHGTGIFLSTPTFEKKAIYQGNDKDFFDKDGKTVLKTLWHMGIRSVDIWMAYFDEGAMQYSECRDCIFVEDMSRDEFQIRFGDDKRFENVSSVGKFKARSGLGGKDVETDMVRIRHYFNKLDGTYTIIVNEDRLLFDGIYRCKHGMLPLIPIQHYEREDSIYGEGIPARYESIRPYINSILKITLDSAWLNASPGLLTDGVEVDGEIYLTAGALEEIKLAGSGGNITTFQTNINVAQLVEVLKVMEDFGMVAGGINYRAPFTSPGKTAFEAGLMKEESNTRARPVIEVDYEGLDLALTIMLINIIDFVPYGLAEKIVDQEVGDEMDRYKIEVKDKVIEEKDGKLTVTDRPGIVDELPLRPDLFIHGVGLKLEIVTPYTTTVMKSIQKAEFGEYVAQYVQLAQIGAPQEMMDKLNDLHGMKPDDMTYKTLTDSRREKFAEATDVAAQILQATNPLPLTPPNAENSNQGGVQQTPAVQPSEAIA